MRANTNVTKVTQAFQVENMTIPVGNQLSGCLFDFYLGRKFDLKNRFSIIPHMGSGISFYHYESSENLEEPEIEARKTFNFNYGLDLQKNFRDQLRQQTYTSKHRRTLSGHVGYFRLSLVNYHSGTSGSLGANHTGGLSVNFGVGVHFRHHKRSVLALKVNSER